MTCEISERERHVLEHATGWHSSNPLYRNHFVAGEDHHDWEVIQLLCTKKLMCRSMQANDLTGGMDCFSVTPNGIALLRNLK